MVVLSFCLDSLMMEIWMMVEEIVFNVVGLGLWDVLYVLENCGFKVLVEGVGKVAWQFIIFGIRICGQQIKFYLWQQDKIK